MAINAWQRWSERSRVGLHMQTPQLWQIFSSTKSCGRIEVIRPYGKLASWKEVMHELRDLAGEQERARLEKLYVSSI